MLLTLLLMMATIAIAAAVAAPTIAFQIRRDREEELVHRGVQYTRAIRTFAKKTGRYPLTLEQLQGTNGVRYIRKLYKDPLTGGDFRLLHMGDVPSPTNMPNLSPSSSGSGNGQNSDTATPSASSDPAAGSAGAPADPQTAAQQPQTLAPNDSRANPVGQVIFGVASKSKARTIREFNHKNHYNEWLFFYDPTYDRGTEIKGPTYLTTVPSPQGAGSPGPPTPAQPPQQ